MTILDHEKLDVYRLSIEYLAGGSPIERYQEYFDK